MIANETLNRLIRQFLVHSYLYYRLDESLISDQQYDEVAQKLRLADDLARRYSIASTPSVVVNGKYRTNAGEAGGSYSKLLNVIDELIAKESFR